MQDPIYVKKIQEADAALGRKLDSDGSLTVSREEIKKILIEKMQMDGELGIKLSTL
jgi:hypothetical protein